MAGPTNTVAPSITYPGQASGAAPMLGQTLTCAAGTWTGTDPIGFTYQWYDATAAANVSGQTAPTMTITGALGIVTHQVYCIVTGINYGGTTNANSNTTQAIVNTNASITPENVVQPQISGPGVVGQAMVCSTRSTDWQGTNLSQFAFQWQKLVAGAWSNILGANQATTNGPPPATSTYIPVLADAGATIRCVVTLTCIGGPSPGVATTPSVLIAIPAPLTVPFTFPQRQHRGPKWLVDIDGIMTTEKQYEDTDVDVQDWSDALNGETITAAVFSTDGIILTTSTITTDTGTVTIQSGNTATTTTAVVTGVGSCHIDITTSSGRVLRKYFRWRRLHRPVLGVLGGGSTLPGEDYTAS